MSESPNFRNLIMLVDLMLPTRATFVYTSDAKENRQTHERAERTSIFSTGSQKLPIGTLHESLAYSSHLGLGFSFQCFYGIISDSLCEIT